VKRISTYLKCLQEGYILSDKTISVNIDKFENNNSKRMLVVGPSGGGKTFLSNILSKKYNAVPIDLDYLSVHFRSFLKRKYDEETINHMIVELICKILKGDYRSIENGNSDILLFYKKLNSSNRHIFEGIYILTVYQENSECKDIILKTPMVIIGKSSLLSAIKAAIRDYKSRSVKGGIWKLFYLSILTNMKYFQKILNSLRSDVLSNKKNKIQELDLDKLEN